MKSFHKHTAFSLCQWNRNELSCESDLKCVRTLLALRDQWETCIFPSDDKLNFRDLWTNTRSISESRNAFDKHIHWRLKIQNICVEKKWPFFGAFLEIYSIAPSIRRIQRNTSETLQILKSLNVYFHMSLILTNMVKWDMTKTFNDKIFLLIIMIWLQPWILVVYTVWRA